MSKLVHYAILDDMKKYGLDPSNYQVTCDKTDPSVIAFLRRYYDMNLPVDVTAWVRVNEPAESLIYGKGLGTQVCFVRDTLGELFYETCEETDKNPTMVISTHVSKSVTLPVYQIHLKKYNVRITLRYNFYNWIISINSEKPLNFDYMDLFDPKEVILDCYCEGFPKDEVYGCYADDHSKFTIDISSYYNAYTFFYLLNNYLENRDKE